MFNRDSAMPRENPPCVFIMNEKPMSDNRDACRQPQSVPQRRLKGYLGGAETNVAPEPPMVPMPPLQGVTQLGSAASAIVARFTLAEPGLQP
jgi:hypothetical protein